MLQRHQCAFCRYHYNANPLLPKIKARLKFADGAAVKQELDKQITELLGPKTEADMVKPDKKAKKKVSHTTCQTVTTLTLIPGIHHYL